MSKAQITTLKNGLRIATDEMKDVETVSIGVFIKTGSRNEDIKINGISHFLEHMAFKGTAKRSAKQIAEEFEGIGGHINAFTSREKTVYYVKVLKEYAEFAVEFLGDILQNSLFDKQEITKECEVILQELAMTIDTPDDIIFDYFQETAFPNQALGRSILGLEKNIKKFSRTNFLKYIDEQYNYQNMVISACGNIKQEDLNKWVKKYFTKFSKNIINPVEKSQYVGGFFKQEKKLEQVNYLLGFEGISYHDKQYYEAQILSMILGGGMSSRLFQELRENHGLAYSVYAFNSCFEDSGIFGIYGGTTPDKCEQMINCISSEIKKICDKIEDEELKRVKTQFCASLKMAKESTSSRMQRLGSDVLLFNRSYSDEDIIEKFQHISKKDIIKIAHQIFNSKPTTAMIGKVKKIQEKVNFI
jgi:predicted Zn-dependent peptidase